jgi:hypothetical protein
MITAAEACEAWEAIPAQLRMALTMLDHLERTALLGSAHDPELREACHQLAEFVASHRAMLAMAAELFGRHSGKVIMTPRIFGERMH